MKFSCIFFVNFITVLPFSFRCFSELFVPVHVQRWTVLPLYSGHDGHLNCSTAVRLHQR